jgi:hypothetical protein
MMAPAPVAEAQAPEAAPAPDADEQTQQSGGEAGGSETASEEPAPEPSPEAAVAPAAAAVARRARDSASHQPAGAAAGNAVAAGNRPEVTQRRAAQRQGIQSADSVQTGEVSTPTFEQALRDAIQQAMPEPRSESEAQDVIQHGAERASAALGQTMGQQQTQAVGNLPAAVDEQAQPDPATMAGGDEVELAPEAVGDAPAGVSAAPVVPPPSTEAAIDTSDNRERVDAVAAESNITEEQLQRGNDPQFEATLGAREEAETNDREAPARLREAEAADRQATRERAQGAIAGGLSAFHGERAQQLNAVAGRQSGTRGLTEERKQQITVDIEAIGAAVRADVTQFLDDMDTEVNDTFQAALDEAMALYEDAFEDVKGGIGTSISDWWNDVSNEERLQMAFAEGRRVYDQRISTAITSVARIVEEKLRMARDRVAEGRAEIDRYMNEDVSEAERDFAEQATTAITADFDALEGEINDRRDALVERMVGMYREGIERRNAREEQLREENKSFWERVYDATVGVIEKVIQFKNMLLGILARAAAVVEAIIQDPIGFLRNLIAGIGAGLERFVANIGENLKQALMGWLFGALEGAGIRLPQTFDLKGFLDIVLQVLGLTKENIRARAVRILGEETVAKIESAVDFLRVLFTEGPAGIWQMLLEKIGNIKDTIIEEIKSWVITKIIVAGVKWIVGLLNPASAFVKACMAIYDIVVFFIQRGQQIIAAVNAIINALGTIVAGNISAMAQAVEGALNRILPVVIGFLASLLGLGGISQKIRQLIEAVQEPVNKAIDWVINKGVSIARRIAGLFGGRGDDQSREQVEEDPDDPEKAMKIEAAKAAIDQAEMATADEGVTRDEAEALAQRVKQDHPAIKTIRVVPGSGKWKYVYTSSPEETHIGKQEAQGTEPPPGVIAEDENTWRIERPIAVSFNVRAKFAEAGLADEYLEQLAEQQAGINDQTVKTWTERRSSYEERSRIAREKRASGEDPQATARAPESAAAQAAARANYRRDRYNELLDELSSDPANSSLSAEELESRANRQVDEEMSQLHALHGPDQIAGGDPGEGGIVRRRLGSARVNVSIGAQWRHAPREETRRVSETDEPRQRIEILDAGVAALNLDEDTKVKTLMNVRLRARFIE